MSVTDLLSCCVGAAQTEEEVERLTRLKAGRMKELVLKRRLELENICGSMHVEPDASTVPEKSIALIDSGKGSELMCWLRNCVSDRWKCYQGYSMCLMLNGILFRPRESF